MTTPKRLNIAYPDNQLVQRYVSSRQVQGKELEFTSSDGVITSGFLTGLDDDAYQVCATPELNSVLLSIPHVIRVVETGRTFADLPTGQSEDVQRFTKVFRRVSENELSRGMDS